MFVFSLFCLYFRFETNLHFSYRVSSFFMRNFQEGIFCAKRGLGIFCNSILTGNPIQFPVYHFFDKVNKIQIDKCVIYKSQVSNGTTAGCLSLNASAKKNDNNMQCLLFSDFQTFCSDRNLKTSSVLSPHKKVRFIH